MKTTRIALVLLLGIMLVSGFACGGGEITPTPTPTPITGFKTYTDTVNGFSISFPEDWLVLPGDAWLMFAVSYCAGQPIMLSVGKNDYYTTDSLETYFYDFLQPFYSYMAEGYTYISVENITLNGVPAIKHLYTEIDSEYGYTRNIILFCTVKDYKGWEIKIEISNECWNSYENQLNTIINSFRFLY